MTKERVYSAGNLKARLTRTIGIFHVSIFSSGSALAAESYDLGKDYKTWKDAEGFVKDEFKSFSEYSPIKREI